MNIQINSVRHAINITMSSEGEWAKPAMKVIQAKARECLLKYVQGDLVGCNVYTL